MIYIIAATSLLGNWFGIRLYDRLIRALRYQIDHTSQEVHISASFFVKVESYPWNLFVILLVLDQNNIGKASTIYNNVLDSTEPEVNVEIVA